MMPAKIHDAGNRAPLFVMLAVFAVSRAIFWFAGVRFDDEPINCFFQYLDQEALKHRLLESCWYQHSQPPGFNLFLGAILKMGGSHSGAWFHAAYLFFGLTIYSGMYRLLRFGGFGTKLSLLLASAFIVSPGAILYENWLFYTWPVAALLVTAAVALARHDATGRTRNIAIFFAALVAVIWTRSLFHQIFALAALALLFVRPSMPWRRLAAMSAVAFAIIIAPCIKNYEVFGFFGTSSWMGMNVWKIASRTFTHGEVQQLIAAGSVPPLVGAENFAPLPHYPKSFHAVPRNLRNIPVLIMPFKVNGCPNYNHYGYIAISREHLKAARFILRHQKSRYLSAVAEAWLTWCRPAWQYGFLLKNIAHIHGYIDAVSAVSFWGRFDPAPFFIRVFGAYTGPIEFASSCIFMGVALLLTAATGIIGLRGMWTRSLPFGRVMAFMAMTVWYVAVIGNALECGENNRFRALSDPLIFVCVALALRTIALRFRAKDSDSENSRRMDASA